MQHTFEIETSVGIDYLILEEGDDIEEIFELYKNDEAGEYLKNEDAKLISYRRID